MKVAIQDIGAALRKTSSIVFRMFQQLKFASYGAAIRQRGGELSTAGIREREADNAGDEDLITDRRLVVKMICEEALVEAEHDVKNYQKAEMEEKPWHDGSSWADMSERDQQDQEVIYDDLTGQILQYQHVIRARLEAEAPRRMGAWETLPLSWEAIRGSWVDTIKGESSGVREWSTMVLARQREVGGIACVRRCGCWRIQQSLTQVHRLTIAWISVREIACLFEHECVSSLQDFRSGPLTASLKVEVSLSGLMRRVESPAFRAASL